MKSFGKFAVLLTVFAVMVSGAAASEILRYNMESGSGTIEDRAGDNEATLTTDGSYTSTAIWDSWSIENSQYSTSDPGHAAESSDTINWYTGGDLTVVMSADIEDAEPDARLWAGGNDNIQVRIRAGGGDGRLLCRYGGVDAQDTSIDPTGWGETLYALQYDSSTDTVSCKYYRFSVNNQIQVAGTGSGTSSFSASVAQLGGSNGGQENTIGRYDEFRIYDEHLTDTELERLATQNTVNQPPVINQTGTDPTNIQIGDTVDIWANMTDPGGSISSATANIYEGGTVQNSSVSLTYNGTYYKANNTFTADSKSYTVEFVATDDGGATTRENLTRTVPTDGLNIPPGETKITPDPLEYNDDVSVEAEITDPDLGEVNSANVSLYQDSLLVVDNASMTEQVGATWKAENIHTVNSTAVNYTAKVYASDSQGDFNTSTTFSYVENTGPFLNSFDFQPVNWVRGDTVSWSVNASDDQKVENVSIVVRENGSIIANNISLSDSDGNGVYTRLDAFTVDKRGVWYNVTMYVSDQFAYTSSEYSQFIEAKFPQLDRLEFRGEWGTRTVLDVGRGLEILLFWAAFGAIFLVVMAAIRNQ